MGVYRVQHGGAEVQTMTLDLPPHRPALAMQAVGSLIKFTVSQLFHFSSEGHFTPTSEKRGALRDFF